MSLDCLPMLALIYRAATAAYCLQGVPTEREVLTTEQGLPVYRIMLRRTTSLLLARPE